jgi:hypothetical protein
MRKKFALCFVLMLFASAAVAASVTLEWDAVPAGTWEKVRIYEKTGSASVLITEVDGNLTQATFEAVPGIHNYVARGYKAPWESADSNTVTSPAVPAAPTNLKFLKIILAGLGALGLVLWKLTRRK